MARCDYSPSSPWVPLPWERAQRSSSSTASSRLIGPRSILSSSRCFQALPTIGPGPTALATLLAFLSGYAVIVFFLRLVSTRSYFPFVYYRIVIGFGLLALLIAGVLQPL